MYKDKIVSLFIHLQENYNSVIELNHAIYTLSSQKSWIQMFQQRAVHLCKIFHSNESLFQELFSLFDTNISTPAKEDYDTLYSWIKRLYVSSFEDPFLLLQLLRIVTPYYEATCDMEHLLFLDLCTGYCYIEISRTGDKKAGIKSVSFYKKVIAQKDHLYDFSCSDNCTYVLTAYCNLILIETSLANIPLKEAYELWDELNQLQKDPRFKELSRNIPRVKTLADYTIDDFPLHAFFYYDEEKISDPELLNSIVTLCHQYYSKKGVLNDDIAKNSFENFFHYQHFLAYTKKISWEKAWENMNTFYRLHIKEVLSQTESYLNPVGLLINPLICLSHALNQSMLSSVQKYEIANDYFKDVMHFINTYPSERDSYSLNNALYEFALDKDVLSLLPTLDKKTDFLIRLVISRQFSTYIHSLMISKLTAEILPFIFQYCPEELIGLPGCTSLCDIPKKEQEILAYTYHASLLHDIGKNAMINIINTEYRKITDEEFSIIKKHPSLGESLLNTDPAFMPYHDIVLGHHKSFDGKSGYPADFDNLSSPYKPLIDLITICDCLDAGSDYLNRNYQNAKTFDTLLQEFQAGAGTRYHPGYVRLLSEHPELSARLRVLLEKQRETIYYEVYQKYFK